MLYIVKTTIDKETIQSAIFKNCIDKWQQSKYLYISLNVVSINILINKKKITIIKLIYTEKF